MGNTCQSCKHIIEDLKQSELNMDLKNDFETHLDTNSENIGMSFFLQINVYFFPLYFLIFNFEFWAFVFKKTQTN